MSALAVVETAGAVKLLDSPGSWASQTDKAPAVLARSRRTGKELLSPGTSNFVSTIMLEIETRLIAANSQAAQDAIEELDALVEQALFTNIAFMSLVQKIWLETETEITAESRNHIAGTRWELRCELVETFDPIADAPDQLQPVAPPFDGMDLHADLVNVFDSQGVYGDGVLFPASVQPAPRESGPDGRDEGALQINFPT